MIPISCSIIWNNELGNTRADQFVRAPIRNHSLSVSVDTGRKFNVRKTSVLCTLSLHLVLRWFVLKNIFKFYGKSLGVFSGENIKLSYENFLLELAFRCSACTSHWLQNRYFSWHWKWMSLFHFIHFAEYLSPAF